MNVGLDIGANSIKAMNDKQAGKFIKFLCDYVFLGRLPETNEIINVYIVKF